MLPKNVVSYWLSLCVCTNLYYTKCIERPRVLTCCICCIKAQVRLNDSQFSWIPSLKNDWVRMLFKLQTVSTQSSYCLFHPSVFKWTKDSDTFPMETCLEEGEDVELNQ